MIHNILLYAYSQWMCGVGWWTDLVIGIIFEGLGGVSV